MLYRASIFSFQKFNHQFILNIKTCVCIKVLNLEKLWGINLPPFFLARQSSERTRIRRSTNLL